jgi:hypothetical protein
MLARVLHVPAPATAYTRGVFSRDEALACGWTPRAIRTRLDSRTWIALGPGRYAEAATWAACDATGQHRLRAIARGLGRRVVLVGPSAAAVHGYPLLQPGTTPVYALAIGDVPAEHIVEVCDVLLTAPARTVIDCARLAGVEAGVVVGDAALRQGAVSKPGLEAMLVSCRHWPGLHRADEMVAEVDGRAESPLESLSRVRLVRLGVPRPELQVEIVLPSGLRYRFDFYWRAFRTVGEADGLSKYTDVGVLRAEKARQLRIEDAELEVVRWSWGEMWRTPELVASRVLRGFDRASKRFFLSLP